MTADELAAIRRGHMKFGASNECFTRCDEEWPCTPARLLALVDTLTRRTEDVEAGLRYSNKACEIMRREKEHGWDEADRWEIQAERVKVERDTLTERLGPCICDYEVSPEGPPETCPQHGRTYAEWVERGDILMQRARTLTERAEAAEAHVERCYTELHGNSDDPNDGGWIGRTSEAEDQVLEVTAERDALRAQVAWVEALGFRWSLIRDKEMRGLGAAILNTLAVPATEEGEQS